MIAHLRPRNIALVALGGAVGTLLRAQIAHLMPTHPGGWPWATLLVNLVGAFVLPMLLEHIAGLRRRFVAWRLLLGTGVLGGFTTYSAFAVETVTLLRGGHALVALGYVAATLTGGVLIGALSLALSTRGGGS